MVDHVIRTRVEADNTIINTPMGTITVAQLVDALQNICDGEDYSNSHTVSRNTGCPEDDSYNIVRCVRATDSLWSIRNKTI